MEVLGGVGLRLFSKDVGDLNMIKQKKRRNSGGGEILALPVNSWDQQFLNIGLHQNL